MTATPPERASQAVSLELIAEMKAAADRATPGPWVRSGVRQKWRLSYGDRLQDSHSVGPDDGKGWVALVPYDERNHAEDFANAAHIAAASPYNVLALLAELERAREERDDTQAALEKLERHDRNMMVDWAERLQAAESLNARLTEQVVQLDAHEAVLTRERDHWRAVASTRATAFEEADRTVTRLTAELAEAREALKRLGSMEAMAMGGMIDPHRDAELLARIHFARTFGVPE